MENNLLNFRSVGEDLEASNVAQFIGKAANVYQLNWSELMRLGVQLAMVLNPFP